MKYLCAGVLALIFLFLSVSLANHPLCVNVAVLSTCDGPYAGGDMSCDVFDETYCNSDGYSQILHSAMWSCGPESSGKWMCAVATDIKGIALKKKCAQWSKCVWDPDIGATGKCVQHALKFASEKTVYETLPCPAVDPES
jgi:hypothetical protein